MKIHNHSSELTLTGAHPDAELQGLMDEYKAEQQVQWRMSE